jgi:hypothetical protein
MKLTLAKLLQLSMRGIGAESLQLYLCAYCWAMEGGSWHIPCAALANLPGAPRGKAFGRVVSELLAAGLIIADGDGYEVPERISAAANRMRNWRANKERNGYASGDVTVESNGGGAAPSPLASPLPSLSDPNSGFSGSSSALSSSQGPVSKPARKAPKTPWPADFDTAIRPGVFEWARAEKYPDWWVNDRLAQMKLDCEAKGLTYVRWLAAATGWLRREDKQYGNGPAAIEARRARGVPRSGGGNPSLPLLLDRIQRMEAADEGS